MSRWLAVLFVAILLCLIVMPAGAENRSLAYHGMAKGGPVFQRGDALPGDGIMNRKVEDVL